MPVIRPLCLVGTSHLSSISGLGHLRHDERFPLNYFLWVINVNRAAVCKACPQESFFVVVGDVACVQKFVFFEVGVVGCELAAGIIGSSIREDLGHGHCDVVVLAADEVEARRGAVNHWNPIVHVVFELFHPGRLEFQVFAQEIGLAS